MGDVVDFGGGRPVSKRDAESGLTFHPNPPLAKLLRGLADMADEGSLYAIALTTIHNDGDMGRFYCNPDDALLGSIVRLQSFVNKELDEKELAEGSGPDVFRT